MIDKKDVDLKSKQFVIFRIDDQEFGANIHKVSIVEKMMNITRVPGTPPYIKGVINLRGEIIPIMSLRLKFGLPEIEADDDTRIVIFKFDEYNLGVVVDGVNEVVSFNDSDIESVTSITNDRSLDYIIGIAKADGRLITLLNIEKLIGELMIKEII
ncbi:MAG: chemotaxis protein CheW [Clostridiaceae bacterium]|nr:chemotaxis protein CheW [Clostridiaceae bacterium]